MATDRAIAKGELSRGYKKTPPKLGGVSGWGYPSTPNAALFSGLGLHYQLNVASTPYWAAGAVAAV